MRQSSKTGISFHDLLDISAFVSVNFAANGIEHFTLYGCIDTAHQDHPNNDWITDTGEKPPPV